MIFAVLTFDRDPLQLPTSSLQWVDLIGYWCQSAGNFAIVGVVLWLLFGLTRMRSQDVAAIPAALRYVFGICVVLSLIGYAAGLVAALANAPGPIQFILFSLAGALAIFAAGLPFVLNLTRLSFRRILALARLSFKEAIRRRVLYAFSAMLVVFLFASWFIPSMPRDQVRTYVSVVFSAMTYLLLFTAALLSAFSIPTDIKQQTIHTIVTKPVERFEVVLGRFLGFLALMTVVLVVMTTLSLLYVLRGINPEAAEESLKARDPLYGELRFENTEEANRAVNVGREWEYRQYIDRPLPGQDPKTARWDFLSVSPTLANRDRVRCEFTFDIYRTTKGDEGRGVACTFRFFTWRFKPGDENLFREERKQLANLAGEARIKAENELAEKFGYWEIPSQQVTDYQTQTLLLPAGLFRNALASDPQRASELKALGNDLPPPFRVRVTCDSPTQYVGMAKHDLYLRLDDASSSERLLFAINFYKGAFGLWLQLALLIGLAVILSTYLNGVISFLVALLLFLGGWSREFIESVAQGVNPGGGPFEALVRLSRRELVGPSLQDSVSTGDQIVAFSDQAFRFFLQRIVDVIPDVNRFFLTNYVAEGFSISVGQLVMATLLLFAYLLPWAVLAYYLMRWREIASST